jgi:lipopolysaccharide export system protein LptA
MNKIKQIAGSILALAMLAGAADAPAKAKAAPPAKVKVEQEGMKSTSDSFNYNLKKRLAIYEGNVRVIDSTLDLSCDKLTVVFMDKADKPAPKAAKKPPLKEGAKVLPGPMVGMGGNVKMLIAEGNVVIINLENKSRAIGDKAIYTQLTEQVVLTSELGNPLPKIIDEKGGELSAPVIIYDRLTGNLRADQTEEANPGGLAPVKPSPKEIAPEPPVRRLGPPKK